MNKIEQEFQSLSEKNEKAFVPYIMAGDGGLKALAERIIFLEKAGATAIEVGIPFSDPVADGPTIQRAGIRALTEGTTLQDVLSALGELRGTVKIPLILMTYLNPIIAYGIDRFASDAEKAGVAGCIIPDLPIEEEGLLLPAFNSAGLELVRLVTLTSPLERIKEIANKSKGYLYAVTVTGITGTRAGFGPEVGDYLARVKSVSTIPVLAGFGISSPEQVKQVSQYCDGVIVGSKIVELFEKNDLEGIEALIKASKTIQV